MKEKIERVRFKTTSIRM